VKFGIIFAVAEAAKPKVEEKKVVLLQYITPLRGYVRKVDLFSITLVLVWFNDEQLSWPTRQRTYCTRKDSDSEIWQNAEIQFYKLVKCLDRINWASTSTLQCKTFMDHGFNTKSPVEINSA
jgi:hypothetical protein